MALDLQPPTLAQRKLRFHGDGSSFFGLHLLTMFLSVVTFGLYSFWGRTRIRSYLYSQTEFAGERFAYHGTGLELLKGWLKAGALFGSVLLLNAALFVLWKDPASAWVTQLIPLAFGLVLAPFAIVGSRRYRLSRTSWQGIRFSFRGRSLDFVKVFVPGALLTAVTLGLYFPFFMVRLQAFMTGQTAYGNERFTFDGKGSELFGPTLMAFFLSPLTFGIYGFWYQAQVERFIWDRTSVAGARFRSTVSGGGLFALTVTNGLLMLMSLGLAYPWVKVREIRYKLSHLALVGNVDWSQIRQDAQAANPTAEGLSDILDLELEL